VRICAFTGGASHSLKTCSSRCPATCSRK
jgi:hypothetical protein